VLLCGAVNRKRACCLLLSWWHWVMHEGGSGESFIAAVFGVRCSRWPRSMNSAGQTEGGADRFSFHSQSTGASLQGRCGSASPPLCSGRDGLIAGVASVLSCSVVWRDSIKRAVAVVSMLAR